MRKVEELVKTMMKLKKREEMLEFLKAILTPSELDEVATRLQIVKMLKTGIPQHEIADMLKVGVATVTRGSVEIKKGRFSNIKPWHPSSKGG